MGKCNGLGKSYTKCAICTECPIAVEITGMEDTERMFTAFRVEHISQCKRDFECYKPIPKEKWFNILRKDTPISERKYSSSSIVRRVRHFQEIGLVENELKNA